MRLCLLSIKQHLNLSIPISPFVVDSVAYHEADGVIGVADNCFVVKETTLESLSFARIVTDSSHLLAQWMDSHLARGRLQKHSTLRMIQYAPIATQTK